MTESNGPHAFRCVHPLKPPPAVEITVPKSAISQELTIPSIKDDEELILTLSAEDGEEDKENGCA